MDYLVDIAREWLGTPFLHQGRRKHIGCDCIGLMLGVMDEAGIWVDGVSPLKLDVPDYTMQPDGKRLKAALVRYLQPVPIDKMVPGHIALMRFEREPQHVGIIGDYQRDNALSLIHCYQQAGKVVEHRLDSKWQRRIIAVFAVLEYKNVIMS